MNIGRVGRVGRVARMGGGGLAAPLTGNDILTITESAGNANITTAAPHGISGLTSIVVSGSSVAGYNTTMAVVDVSATILATDQVYIGDATGGTWALA